MQPKAANAYSNMSHIAELLEQVFLDDNCSVDSDNEVKEYFLQESIVQDTAKLQYIIRWEYQLSKFIYTLHTKNIHVESIAIDELMVDENLNIIGETIRPTVSNGTNYIEATTIDSIFKVHKSIFEYLKLKYKTKNEKMKLELLYNISNFYYITSIDLSSKRTVKSFLNCINQFFNMVELGLVDKIWDLSVFNSD